MTVRYRADYAGTRQLMKSAEMQAVVREVAEKGKAYAESIAPVGDPLEDPHSGEYKSSFEVNVTDEGGINPPGVRAEAQLINTSAYAAAVEWGNSAYPPYAHGYHVLARTLSALGSL